MRAAPRSVQVLCTVDVEQSRDSLHAHVDLDGIDVGPGDTVIVEDAPWQVGFGERRIRRCRALVTRAGWFERLRTKLAAHLALTELYEVSFSTWRRP
ncbi:MAG: hypothetical protein JNK11_15300 [Alphaproteobacteria bacterium]|nr:hypothetical protein [Alphaproteobacteria bacterium]